MKVCNGQNICLFGKLNLVFGFGTQLCESPANALLYLYERLYINHRMKAAKDEVTGKIDKMDFWQTSMTAGLAPPTDPASGDDRYRAVKHIQIYRSANTGISVIVDLGAACLGTTFKIANIKAPLYTCTTIPHPPHPYLSFVFVYIALMLLVASFIIPKVRRNP